MEKVILVRYGEISLKGLNKAYFIDMLIKNIKTSLRKINSTKIEKIQGRFIIRVAKENFDEALICLKKVFGIVSISEAYCIEKEMDKIQYVSLTLMKEINENVTFKVESRRADKKFQMNSQELSSFIGGHILKNTQNFTVDVKKPDVKLYIEIREKAYIYNSIIPGLGGLPVGCSGKAALLLSGGIDSPVAGYLMAKRGVTILGVHFHSFPYTSDRAKEKVIELTKILSSYTGAIKLYIVSFTDIQQELLLKCNERLTTILMRRIMMKISEEIAIKENAKALITGESLGQVASQTMESLSVTNNAVELPVFRPLIGMDKNEIIKISENINTFETSILPYEDCCTVFVPKHPETRPKLEKVLNEEKKVEFQQLIDEAINNAEIITI
ncbi:MAG: tRNA uracil 4-sulfurtransferase ThiI [Eubacteriaceae bacterium]